MNSTLIDYGIYEEDSHIRAHVAPVVKIIYVFRTQEALKILDHSEYPEVPGFQPGVSFPTAKGKLVPPDDIPDIRPIRWDGYPWWKYFDENDSTEKKGKRAVLVVASIMRLGLFPLWFDAEEIKDIDVDIKGTDMIVWGKWRIQVKCDFRAGPKKLGGTGNLFIQTKECNPLGKH